MSKFKVGDAIVCNCGVIGCPKYFTVNYIEPISNRLEAEDSRGATASFGQIDIDKLEHSIIHASPLYQELL